MIDFFVVVLINNYRWINWFLMIDINYDVIEDLKNKLFNMFNNCIF